MPNASRLAPNRCACSSATQVRRSSMSCFHQTSVCSARHLSIRALQLGSRWMDNGSPSVLIVFTTDAGGSNEAMAELNRARDDALGGRR